MTLRRSLLIGVLIYGLLLAGLSMLNGAFVAIAFPLVMYLGAVLLHVPAPPDLSLSRHIDRDFVEPGAKVKVALTITNEGAEIEEMAVRDLVPEGLVVEGSTSVVVTLGPGESHQLEYAVEGQRGTYRFGPVHVAVAERLALFQQRERYDVRGKLSVLPSTPRVRSLKIRPLRTRGFAGPIPSRQGGSGTDFFGVRAYEPGDPPQFINWRMSARHPREIYTNVFEQERIADVGLILDARTRADVIANGQSLFEHAIEVTAGLADSFLKDGNRVGLLVYGRGLERTFPDYGKHQRQRILRALSRAQIGDSLVFDSLDYLPTKFFPAKSQLVLISPLCEDDPPVIVRLRARGYQILVVSPDPVDFEARGLTPGAVRDLAVRIANAERQLWIRQLQRIGVPVVSWQVGQSLDATLRADLKKYAPQAWRR